MRPTSPTAAARLLAAVAGFAVVAVLAPPAVPPAAAEVSINGNGTSLYFQGEPGKTWTRHRNGVASHRILNPFGDARGDGAPALAKNPVTLAWEATWGRAGTEPAVLFAWFEPEADAWRTEVIAVAPGSTPWAGRVVALHHDEYGNRFVVFDDPGSGQVLLASAPRDSVHVNRPIRVNRWGTPAHAPVATWDGVQLVVAHAHLAPGGGIDVVEIEPVRDAEGRIPNGGEGIPGIPEPVFSWTGDDLMRPAVSSEPVSSVGGGPGSGPGPRTFDPGPLPGDSPGRSDVPPLLVLEELADGRLLLTWVHEDALLFTFRSAGSWSGVGEWPLPDPVEHEAAREDVRRQLTGRGGGRR